MKKTLLTGFAILYALISFAQDDPTDTEKKKDRSKISLANRSTDHSLIQFGYAGWAGKPDSINTKGLSRRFNFYVMMDFPFKTDPRFSVALGPGVGTDHIFFENTIITIAGQTNPSRLQHLPGT